MFKSGELGDELLALKSEMSRLLGMPADNMFETAKSRSEALADQIKTTLSELGETLSEEEEHVERQAGVVPPIGANAGGAKIHEYLALR